MATTFLIFHFGAYDRKRSDQQSQLIADGTANATADDRGRHREDQDHRDRQIDHREREELEITLRLGARVGQAIRSSV